MSPKKFFLLLSGLASVFAAAVPFSPLENLSQFEIRDGTTCGGIADLEQCGDGFPADFCCSSGKSCIKLNTTTTAIAAICCPAGQDCQFIQPVPCDQNLQNATATPLSQFHSDPPQALEVCASSCCPMGYDCKDSNCVAKAVPASTVNSTSSAGITPLSTPSGNLSSDASSSLSNSNNSSSFSGQSFAAGFVPGIVLGAVVAGLLVACVLRRRKDRKSKSKIEHFNEKSSHSDENLTPLSPSHMRNISDPITSPSRSHRTDFLRGSPVRTGPAPCTPDRPPVVQPAFSHSPFMDPPSSTPPRTQSPLPSHLKRGTLSFTIAPLRALKKQKSMHSLRRQVTNASTSSSSELRRPSERSRTDSTETIQVHMGDGPYTPDQRNLTAAKPQPSPSSNETAQHHHPAHISVPSSSSSWETRESDMCSPEISNPDPPPPIPASYAMRFPYNTPPTSSLRPNGPGETPVLGTPYTPSRVATRAPETMDGDGGLAVQDDAHKRDTTFSGIMRTAGLSQSDLVPMPKKR